MKRKQYKIKPPHPDKVFARNGLKYSDEVIGMIKAIINRDRIERHRAGFKYQTHGLVKRLSEEFHVNYWTVKEIKERRRRQITPQCRLMHAAKAYDPEVSEEIRQHRIRKNLIGASWRGLMPNQLWPTSTYKKQLYRRGRPK